MQLKVNKVHANKRAKFFEKIIFFGLIAALFFLSAFRLNVGTDYVNYVNLYQYLGTGKEYWGTIEPGFDLVVKWLFSITEDPRIFFVFFSFFTLSFFSIGFIRYSPAIVLSLLVFLGMYHYFLSLNLVRQYLALSIFLGISTKYLIRRQFFKYLLSIIFASLFHFSVIFMVPFYFFLIRKWGWITYFCLTFLSFLAFLFYSYLSNFIFSASFYQTYLSYQSGSSNFYLLSVVLLFLIPFVHKEKVFSLGQDAVVYFNSIFLSILIIPFSYHNIMFFRVSLYFSIYLVFLIPMLYRLLKSNADKFIFSVFVFTILSVNLFYHWAENVGGVRPFGFGF